jgi:hypothetical protein
MAVMLVEKSAFEVSPFGGEAVDHSASTSAFNHGTSKVPGHGSVHEKEGAGADFSARNFLELIFEPDERLRGAHFAAGDKSE